MDDHWIGAVDAEKHVITAGRSSSVIAAFTRAPYLGVHSSYYQIAAPGRQRDHYAGLWERMKPLRMKCCSTYRNASPLGHLKGHYLFQQAASRPVQLRWSES
jgi:hypothetical protein